MSSPGEDIRAVISAHIISKLGTAYPTMKVYFENQKFTQPQNTPWCFVNIIENETCRVNIGSPRQFKSLGVVTVSCMAPEDSNTKTLREITDRLTAALADVQLDVPGSGSLTFYGVQKRSRGVVNGWFTIMVICEFRHWHTLPSV